MRAMAKYSQLKEKTKEKKVKKEKKTNDEMETALSTWVDALEDVDVTGFSEEAALTRPRR
eukprot:2226535-Lingulodinium_polyedra.AAC.1